MPTLHPLDEQVIKFLSQTMQSETNNLNQKLLLADIERRRFTPPPEAPDSTELLREARNQ